MVNIAYGIDNKYLPPPIVSMYTVLRTASGPVNITVFATGSEFDPSSIYNVANFFPNASLDVRQFETDNLKEYEKTEIAQRFPAASMVPLFIPWLVDEKCLFLDADTLILQDIAPLFHTDLNDCLIGAVQVYTNILSVGLVIGATCRDFACL